MNCHNPLLYCVNGVTQKIRARNLIKTISAKDLFFIKLSRLVH